MRYLKPVKGQMDDLVEHPLSDKELLAKHLESVLAAFERYSEAMRQRYSAGYGDNGGILQDAYTALAKVRNK